MSVSQRFPIALSTLALTACLAAPALAIPTAVTHQDDPDHCDFLFIPERVEEVGLSGVFPADSALELFSQGETDFSPCEQFDNPQFQNVLVSAINLTGRELTEAWYVADPETRISNHDGFANDINFFPEHLAFRIDNKESDPSGMHHPLVDEDILVDGIWQPGETWTFVLQDYQNSLGVPAEAIASIGVGDLSAGLGGPAGPPSSGSIIAIGVPEPTTAVLVLGMAATLASRRSRR